MRRSCASTPSRSSRTLRRNPRAPAACGTPAGCAQSRRPAGRGIPAVTPARPRSPWPVRTTVGPTGQLGAQGARLVLRDFDHLSQIELRTGERVDERVVRGIRRQSVATPCRPQPQRARFRLPKSAAAGEDPAGEFHGVDDLEGQPGPVAASRRRVEKRCLDPGVVREQDPPGQRGQDDVKRFLDRDPGLDGVVGQPVNRRARADARRGTDEDAPGAREGDHPSVDRHPPNREDVISGRIKSGGFHVDRQQGHGGDVEGAGRKGRRGIPAEGAAGRGPSELGVLAFRAASEPSRQPHHGRPSPGSRSNRPTRGSTGPRARWRRLPAGGGCRKSSAASA